MHGLNPGKNIEQFLWKNWEAQALIFDEHLGDDIPTSHVEGGTSEFSIAKLRL